MIKNHRAIASNASLMLAYAVSFLYKPFPTLCLRVSAVIKRSSGIQMPSTNDATHRAMTGNRSCYTHRAKCTHTIRVYLCSSVDCQETSAPLRSKQSVYFASLRRKPNKARMTIHQGIERCCGLPGAPGERHEPRGWNRVPCRHRRTPLGFRFETDNLY